MFPISRLEDIERHCSWSPNLYPHDCTKILGIMVARYSLEEVRTIVRENYDCWHVNSGKKFDVFWLGYDSRFSFDCMRSEPQTVSQELCFSEAVFSEEKGKLERISRKEFPDKDFGLLLVKWYQGRIHYDDSIYIKLNSVSLAKKKNLRELMELIINYCGSESSVQKLKNQTDAAILETKVLSFFKNQGLNLLGFLLSVIQFVI